MCIFAATFILSTNVDFVTQFKKYNLYWLLSISVWFRLQIPLNMCSFQEWNRLRKEHFLHVTSNNQQTNASITWIHTMKSECSFENENSIRVIYLNMIQNYKNIVWTHLSHLKIVSKILLSWNSQVFNVNTFRFLFFVFSSLMFFCTYVLL